MAAQEPHPTSPETVVTVRYWAGARAAAGVDSETVPLPDGASLATVIAAVLDRHRDRPRFADVVAVSSMLVGDRPVGSVDPASVVPQPGDTVEILPPFAGG